MFSFLPLTHSAFCPYHIGHFSVVGLGFEEYVRRCFHQLNIIFIILSQLNYVI